jgi:hypothetical protein
MPSMVRKQLYITPEQDRRLRQAAAKRRRTEAEVMREALDRHLVGGDEPDRTGDPLWGMVAIGQGGVADGSVEVDHYVYGTPKRRR